MDIIKFSSGHAQGGDATETIWSYTKPSRIVLNNCVICLAGFVPEEYGKVSKYNQPGNFKHILTGYILNQDEIESMCDLQFNITTLTHPRLQRDGEMRECIHYMLAEQILWYNMRRNTGQMKNVLDKLQKVYCQVKFGVNMNYMLPESGQRIQQMSQQMMVGFNTDNAHIMVHKHGNDIETLVKNMVTMFTDGQNKTYTAQFQTEQKVDRLQGSLSALIDLFHRGFRISENNNFNDKNLKEHDISTGTEQQVFPTGNVTSQNSEKSGENKPQTFQTDGDSQKPASANKKGTDQ